VTKWVGAVLLLGFGAVTLTGYEPFTSEERGSVPPGARRGPGGGFLWFGGIHGGK
jgi:hypothetical protein